MTPPSTATTTPNAAVAVAIAPADAATALANAASPADLAHHQTHSQHSQSQLPPHSSIQLVVGKIDAGVAILLTGDHHILEFPTLLLPPDIATGSIIDVSVSRNARAETEALLEFSQLQDAILAELGDAEPVAPTLTTAAPATETSVVLQWSGGLAVGGTQQESTLDIVVNNDVIASHHVAPGALSGECEVDGLEPGYQYTCQVVLRCGGSSLASDPLVVRTLGEREHAASPRVERRASLTLAATIPAETETTTTETQHQLVPPASSSRPASPLPGNSAFDEVALSPPQPEDALTRDMDLATALVRAPSPLAPVTTAPPPRSRSTSPTRRPIPEFTDPADDVIKKAVSNKSIPSPAEAPVSPEAAEDTHDAVDPLGSTLDQQNDVRSVEPTPPTTTTTDALGQVVADPSAAPTALLDLAGGSPHTQAAPAPPPGSTAADILMGGFDASGLMDVALDAPVTASEPGHDLLGLDVVTTANTEDARESDEQVAAKEPLPASPEKTTQEETADTQG